MNLENEFSPQEIAALRILTKAKGNGISLDQFTAESGMTRGEVNSFAGRLFEAELLKPDGDLSLIEPTRLLVSLIAELDRPTPSPYKSAGLKMEPIDHFTDSERKIMRQLAKEVDSKDYLGCEEKGSEFGIGRDAMFELVRKLSEFGLAKLFSRNSFKVRRELVAVLHDFDNRAPVAPPAPPPIPEPSPPADKVQEAYSWFASKPWGAVVLIAIAVLGVLAGVIGNLGTILGWFGVEK